MPPPHRMHGPFKKARDPKKTLLRILSYLKHYIPNLLTVMLCIVASAVASTVGSTALGSLVDDYILPLVSSGSADFAALWSYIVKLACIFLVGIVANFLQNYLMVPVTQGVQKTIRDETFAKMQHLPIRYFDSNAAGDIMSRYTSDIDTMRQLISMSIPQAFASIVTLVAVLTAMLRESWMLTIVTMFTVSGVFFVTKYLAGKSGKFFAGQQKSLGAVNGYI